MAGSTDRLGQTPTPTSAILLTLVLVYSLFATYSRADQPATGPSPGVKAASKPPVPKSPPTESAPSRKADAKKAALNRPDSKEPDSKKLDSKEPDSKKSDSKKSDSKRPDAKPGELAAKGAPLSVEELAAKARGAVVVITVAGRTERDQALGTGFVVANDGLIATNRHVIGDGRPVNVAFSDGRQYPATAVHATDRALDLALLRIDARNLPVLPLGDSDQVKPGQPAVMIGNPLGLTYSVVSGVISARREMNGRPMLQVAMPVERGNSGGPILDFRGHVVGIITEKSLRAENLGFAVAINALKPLLSKPNPVPMERWITIHTLDPQVWQPLFGARWRQKGGRVTVDGAGDGFGGRSLCLAKAEMPAIPFEVGVWVRLDDEAGAAGLVLHADGADRHLGFYPSAGQMRFSRFEGPDVLSWAVLRQAPSKHYRPSEWNHLKTRVEKSRVLCFVNGQQVFEVENPGMTSGRVGLAKFRQTQAEFRHFRVGASVSIDGPSDAIRQRAARLADTLPPGNFASELVRELGRDAPQHVLALREQAKMLEQRAERLRQLAQAAHAHAVQRELSQVLSNSPVDLAHAALLIAKLDNDDLDVDAYRAQVERMARQVRAQLPPQDNEQQRLDTLKRFLFEEMGFHGSRADYYNPANSYLSQVIDDREGIPITLSVLYMELGRRLDLHLEGVGLPGHFVIRHVPKKGEPTLIDVYEGAVVLSKNEASLRVLTGTGEPLDERLLAPMSARAILERMLGNLLGLARREDKTQDMLRYLDLILQLNPDSVEQRLLRALIYSRTNQREAAVADAEYILRQAPEGVNLDRVREFRDQIQQRE